MDAVKGQTDRKRGGGKLCQSGPIENPSCLTHICQQDTQNWLAVPQNIFLLISMPHTFPAPSLLIILTFVCIQMDLVCF